MHEENQCQWCHRRCEYLKNFCSDKCRCEYNKQYGGDAGLFRTFSASEIKDQWLMFVMAFASIGLFYGVVALVISLWEGFSIHSFYIPGGLVLICLPVLVICRQNLSLK